MSSTPPAGGSGSQGAQGPDQPKPPSPVNRRKEGERNKEFKLPEKKKKDKQDAPAGQPETKAKGVSVGAEEAKSAAKTSNLEATAQAQQISAVNKVIVNMVDGMRAGENVVQMDLKSTTEVPTAFQGAQLTIDKSGIETTIRFDNFKTDQAQLDAQHLITQHAEALQQLSDQLFSRGVQQAHIALGQNITIALPTPSQALPSPEQTFSGGQQSFEREGGGQSGGGGGKEGGEPQE